LSQIVDVVFPLAPTEEDGFIFYPEPVKLADALATLGTQIGVRITAVPELENVPVNPCTFRNLPLQTALDLLLRQWPVAGYGYEVRDDGILLRPASGR
jgi:hypothetical protein